MPHARDLLRTNCPQAFRLALLIATILCGGLPLAARAQTPVVTGSIRIQTEQFYREVNGGTLAVGTDVRFDPLGNTYISDQRGDIRTINGGVISESRFIDLRSETVFQSGGEGLMSFAFHPDYDNAGSPGYRKLYTFHTTADDGQPVDFNAGTQGGSGAFVHINVITEWQTDDAGSQIVEGSRRTLLRAGHALDRNHSGGSLVFDDQGYLAYSFGTPLPQQGQDTTTLYGAAIRIDPLDPAETPDSPNAVSANGAYRVPNDNPFVGNAAALDEIYAYGLRNPFRLSFDEVSGLYFAGDVGQGAREEISVLSPGDNFGWPVREGSRNFQPNFPLNPLGELIDPLVDYGRTVGRAVIGGFVYRGAAIPELQGKYVFGDFTTNRGGVPFRNPGSLFYLDLFDDNGELRDPAELVINEFLIDTGDGTPFLAITSLAQDLDGELYYIGQRENAGGLNRVTVNRIIASDVITGDYDRDGDVDLDDYAVWRDSFGQEQADNGPLLPADGNNSGTVGADDYTLWRDAFAAALAVAGAAAPEPSGAGLLLAALGLLPTRSRRSETRVAGAGEAG